MQSETKIYYMIIHTWENILHMGETLRGPFSFPTGVTNSFLYFHCPAPSPYFPLNVPNVILTKSFPPFCHLTQTVC